MPIEMLAGSNSSSAVGSRNETGLGTGSVLLLDKLLSDDSSGSVVSELNELVATAGDGKDTTRGLRISTQFSSESEEVVSDELLSISSTSIGFLVGGGTCAKNPLIFSDPAAALRNLLCFL